MTKILIPMERATGETRVAATPETVKKMIQSGLEVRVEAGAGERCFVPDDRFAKAGAEMVAAGASWSDADVVLKVGPLVAAGSGGGPEVEALAEGSVLIGLLDPFTELDTVGRLAERRISTLAMEMIPRITRAQGMDALSSQANIAGYKSVLIAANRLSRYFPLLMTAAGTIPPARVVILGAGVAGLQAVATAKRLGAVVEVSDIRPAVKEQVESLGGRFIDLPLAESGEGSGGYAREMGEDFLTRQRQILSEHLAAADAVITTAAVPGKPAPRLVTRDMVEGMRPGSVIVDLAAERGGNCELCRPGEEVVHQGVLILGPLNIAASMAFDASAVYARNVLALLQHMTTEGRVGVDPEDEIVAGALVTHDGKVVHAAIAQRLQQEVAP